MIKSYEGFTGDELSPRDIKRTKERIANEFWIDRNGNEHHFNGSVEEAWDRISLHTEIAIELFPDNSDPKHHLLDTLGWIMVGSTVYSCPIIHKRPSELQLDTLFDLGLYKRLCILKDNSYPKWSDVEGDFKL